MKEFTLSMALADVIPVIIFLLAMSVLGKDLQNKMSRTVYLVFILGVFLIGGAGFLKFLYKLLYALGVGDFLWLSNQFFPHQSLGFLLTGIAMTIYVTAGRDHVYGFLPVMAYVGIMVIGVGALEASLAFLANRMKRNRAMVLFIVTFFLYMMMGYLSSKDFSKASLNWIAEGINILGQLCQYAGIRILHKAGLGDN